MSGSEDQRSKDVIKLSSEAISKVDTAFITLVLLSQRRATYHRKRNVAIFRYAKL